MTFKLPKNPIWHTEYSGIHETLGSLPLNARNISDAIISIRQNKLPNPDVIGNAGSFFKNPVLKRDHWHGLKEVHPNLPGHTHNGGVKTSAAWLIDQCNWKGKRFGDAGVYDKHALVLVNHGEATGEDLWLLAGQIIASVEDKFGISLEPEPRIIEG